MANLLHQLDATGSSGFEGLVGNLLQQISGLDFRLARSGDQRGRDGRASRPGGGSVMFECKKYLGTTTLNNRDLISEMVQAVDDVPDLDVWILATTRNIPDQALTELEAKAAKGGFEILALDCRDDGSGALDCLCAAFPGVVLEALEYAGIRQNALTQARLNLDSIACSPGFDLHRERLRERIAQPSFGWPIWQAQARANWLTWVKDEASTRAFFGQPLHVLSESSNSVTRKQAILALDRWWETWPTDRRMFVLQGEEGDGKSWAVAQWLANRLENSPEGFPPIVFIPSRAGGGSARIDDLLANHLKESLGENNWKLRLQRWRASGRARGNLPLALVVLDGINERHSPGFWRDVIEGRLVPEWRDAIAVICTARTAYWREHFALLQYLDVTLYTIPPLDDAELKEALAKRNQTLGHFPDELHPLLRKPRYLDLALKHHKKLTECGDFTLARLIYEDWRDRCQRKGMPFSEDAFNDFLREIARRHQDDSGRVQIQPGELAEFLALQTDREATLCELSTGGVLDRVNGRWQVEPNRLALGLGMLLCDQVIAEESRGGSLSESIASWIEPHTGLDIQARILEHAALYSLGEEVSEAVGSALLLAWLDTQNPESTQDNPIESRFTAYLPQRPGAYFRLAEIIWSSHGNHPWGQEVLIYGLIRWGRSSQHVVTQLPKLFERWLGMIPIYGPPSLRGSEHDNDHSRNLRVRLCDALDNKIELGNTVISGYQLVLIDDDGWLRLARAALAVISHLDDREPFLRAIVSGVLAEAVFHHPGKGELFAWIFRSSKRDLWNDVSSLAMSLLASSKTICHQAAARLMNYAGTERAWRARECLDIEHLFPTPQWIKDVRQDPYNSGFAWSREQFQSYPQQPDFQAWRFIRHASNFTLDPALTLPEDISNRLSPVADDLAKMPLWQGQGRTIEDHRLEETEMLLARYCPEQFANVIRSLVGAALERTRDSLIRLTWELADYDLLLTDRERKALLSVWEKNRDDLCKEDGNPIVAEAYLFLALLPFWPGHEQLVRLTERSEDAFDLLLLKTSFVADNKTTISAPRSSKAWARTLWFLTITRQALLSPQQLSTCLAHSDDFVQGCALRYLHHCGKPDDKTHWVENADWRWHVKQHFMEEEYGALLLIQHAKHMSVPELLQRIPPTYWGIALKQRQVDSLQWRAYAESIGRALQKMIDLDLVDRLPRLRIEHNTEVPQPVGLISIIDDEDHTMRIVRPESVWGGRDSGTWPNFSPDIEADRARWRANHDLLNRLHEEAAAAGHYWLDRTFSIDGLSEAIDSSPDLARQWVKKAIYDDRESRTYLHRARNFYLALCEVLLGMPILHEDAVNLYLALDKTAGPVKVIAPGIELAQLDLALMNSKHSPALERLWNRKLEQGKTDKDLLDLALSIRAAKLKDSSSWIADRINEDIASPVPYQQARAMALRGLLDGDESAVWQTEVIPKTTYWIQEVIATAQERLALEKWSRHWFRLFCKECGRERAWGAFRLFLACADRRCWLWLNHEIEANPLPSDKFRFFLQNQETIKKHCTKNEKKWGESFLNCPVESGLWPWMDISATTVECV